MMVQRNHNVAPTDLERVFGRMLWLNPTDNQGARFLIDDLRARTAWEDRREDR